LLISKIVAGGFMEMVEGDVKKEDITG